MAIGAKRNETRSRLWHLNCDLSICSAKLYWNSNVPDAALPALRWLWHYREKFSSYGSNVKDLYDSMPFGKVVAVVHAQSGKASHLFGENELTQQEHELGDYSAGRFIYETGLLRPLKVPVAVSGFQGLFNLPADVEAKVMAQL